jgi:D-citramalate synthase
MQNEMAENNKQKQLEIMDTTLRDGEQMDKVSFSPLQKLEIAKKLFDIGIDRIEVASARAVDNDAEALRLITNYAKTIGKLHSVEVLGFVDNTKSVDWIYDNGGRTLNLLAKGSKKHCEEQLGKKLEVHLADILNTINYALSKDFHVNIYLEDWSSGMTNSPEYVFEMIEKLKQHKIERFMLPDTLGILNPMLTQKYVTELKKIFPSIKFDFHAHNDYGLATANTMYAIIAGISGVHLTLNSLGERAGNCSLFEIVACANDHLKLNLNIKESEFYNLKNLTEIASKMRISANAPIVGDNVHRQTAGVHAHGDKKGNLYKTILSPERFGKTTTTYSLGKQSGQATIEISLKQLGVTVDDETLKRITSVVRKLGEQGKTVTQEDLLFIQEECYGNSDKLQFRFLEASTQVNMSGKKISHIKILFEGQEMEETALGDGGYDAIMNALLKLAPQLKIPLAKLVDYNPRIPPGGKTDALVETIIDWEHNNEIFTTVGLDCDQTISAVKATEKMINLMIRKTK